MTVPRPAIMAADIFMRNNKMRFMLLMLLLLAGGAALAQPPVTLTHVHGLAYSPDGRRLMVPSHHGISLYKNGAWSKAPGPQHDYMGFAATADAIYSSGHPAPGSGMVNPFGVIRSRDGGRTWDKLGLEGEADFHLLASGWSANAIYVWNPAPNSRMSRAGLHYSTNDGRSWKAARARGLEGEPHALAVHPRDKRAVAVATVQGVFESLDAGESFQKLTGGECTAVFYDLEGRHLWYGSFDGKARLLKMRLRGGPITEIRILPLENDAVAYIAQNPVRQDEYAFATFRRSVFITKDAGDSWTAIAANGVGK